MKLYKIFVLLLFILLSLSKYGFSISGNYGINSLDLDATGAREFGMGEASVGLGGDANIIAVNPAGLAHLTTPEVNFMYYLGFEDDNFITGDGAYALPANYGVVGVSFQGFTTKGIPAFDETGNSVGALNTGDATVILGYANNPLQFFNINQDLNIGINLKFGSSTIDSISKSFFALDIGALYGFKFSNFWDKTKEDCLSIGASIQNLGPAVTYIDEATELPQKEKFGLGWQTFLSKQLDLNVAADYIIAVQGVNSLHLGAEVVIIKMFSVRLGYIFSNNTTDSITVGGGAKMMISKYELNANYAFVPAGDFGATHAISIGFKF